MVPDRVNLMAWLTALAQDVAGYNLKIALGYVEWIKVNDETGSLSYGQARHSFVWSSIEELKKRGFIPPPGVNLKHVEVELIRATRIPVHYHRRSDVVMVSLAIRNRGNALMSLGSPGSRKVGEFGNLYRDRWVIQIPRDTVHGFEVRGPGKKPMYLLGVNYPPIAQSDVHHSSVIR